jgi:hypothetical protein
MGATPFSARLSQPTLSASVDLQPHLYCTPAIANLFHFLLKRVQQFLEAWLTQLQDYKTRESSGSHLNQPLAN